MLHAVALGITAFAAFLPASAAIELFPYWDLDPTLSFLPSTGLTPSHTLALAILALLGLAAALLAERRAGRGWRPMDTALAAVGVGAVLIHGLATPGGLEDLHRAAPWINAAAVALAAVHLARRPRSRMVLLALALAFAVPLLVRGLLQLMVEHPATVAEFRRDTAEVLAARGWELGSPNALAYERRLLQPELSAWFGLSNVAATFLAAAVAGLLALAVVHARAAGRVGSAVLPVAAAGAVGVAAAVGLALTRSKGGYGAFALAAAATAAVAVVMALRHRRPAVAGPLLPAIRWIGPAVIGGVLALVAVRGLVGEAADERSVLFRAYYAVGALRIWAENPLLGVGPDGFQDAYAGAKLPLAVETVTSPHSVLFDWTATLGVLGLAWCGWLVMLARRLPDGVVAGIGREPDHERPTLITRDTVRLVVLVVAAVSLAATAAERTLATPAFAVTRVVALVGWLAGALVLLPALRSRSAQAWAALAAGIALVAHAQIEVTPVWTNAAPLFALFLAAAATNPVGDSPGSQAGPPTARPRGPLIAAVAAGGLAAVLVLPLASTLRWQSHLAAAAETVRPAAEARAELQAALAEPDPAQARPALDRLAAGLSGRLSARIPPRPAALAAAADALRIASLEPAAEQLALALAARPAHHGTRSARGKVLLQIAMAHPDAGLALAAAETALDEARDGLAVTAEPTVAALDWHAVVAERVGEVVAARAADAPGTADRLGALSRESAGSWSALLERTPHTPRPAIRLMDLSVRIGDEQTAREMAGEALRRDALTRLDPLAGLTSAERARAEALRAP